MKNIYKLCGKISLLPAVFISGMVCMSVWWDEKAFADFADQSVWSFDQFCTMDDCKEKDAANISARE